MSKWLYKRYSCGGVLIEEVQLSVKQVDRCLKDRERRGFVVEEIARGFKVNYREFSTEYFLYWVD